MNQAFLVLEQNGLSEGRAEVDTVTRMGFGNMKELRPPGFRMSGRLRQIGLLGPAERMLAEAGEGFSSYSFGR